MAFVVRKGLNLYYKTTFSTLEKDLLSAFWVKMILIQYLILTILKNITEVSFCQKFKEQ